MSLLPVLIVEDDAPLREALRDTLELAGYTVLEADGGPAALACLARTAVGIVVSDVQMRPTDGHALLKQIKQRWPQVPVLLMTAYGLIERAVEAMRDGACNYLTKPIEPDSLVAEVARWMLPAAGSADDLPVGEDPATRGVLEMARRVAATDATVLLTGESGSGKEVVARFIHQASPRAAGPFVAVNCAAIPEHLIEATFFGHEKGSFTGASQTHAGKFEQAAGGTLVLDEITETPPGLQAKLLRALQEREVERVGGKRPIPVDVRVIATSNRDIEAAVRGGQFREDLYFRLNVFPLRVPALRERPADILPLAERFLARAARHRAGLHLSFSEAARRGLTAHTWRGNIRELQNVVERAVILAPGAVIEPEHLCLPRVVPERATPPVVVADRDLSTVERDHILHTLAECGGVRKEAARRLGMSERTLRHKLQQYREEDRAAGGDPDGSSE